MPIKIHSAVLLASALLLSGCNATATSAPSQWSDLSAGDVQLRYANPDHALAAHYYRRSAEQGNRFAMHKLGQLYEKGQGVPQNHARAADLYRQAAELGNPWGKFEYGGALFEGRGVARDRTKAIRFLEEAAAETGNQWPQFRLGMSLRQIDPARSRQMLELSARQGNEMAARELAR